MLQKSLALVLTCLLLAPLNSGAAAWMAMSMSEGDLSSPAAEGHHIHDSHETRDARHGGDHHAHSMPVEDHDHSEEDCEEHCMSCSNHCSSLAIVSNHVEGFQQSVQQLAVADGLVSNHSELLFRPPIRA